MAYVTNQVYTASAYPNPPLYELYGPNYTPPGSFRAGILRTSKGTLLLFGNGKVVINKCKSIDDASDTAWECLEATGLLITDIKLVNICGCVKLGKRVKLETLHVTGGYYEPELHHGYLFYVGKVSVIVYHTGTVMFCGCKSQEEFDYVSLVIASLI